MYTLTELQFLFIEILMYIDVPLGNVIMFIADNRKTK